LSSDTAPEPAREFVPANTEAGDDDLPLIITVHATERSLLLRVTGELDLNTVLRLQQALEAALTPMPEEVILDFRHLDFIDSAGLALLIDLRHRFYDRPSFLTLLVASEGQVREVLELSRFDQFFQIEIRDGGPESTG
jgi:anti-sigma B factor antagonist